MTLDVSVADCSYFLKSSFAVTSKPNAQKFRIWSIVAWMKFPDMEDHVTIYIGIVHRGHSEHSGREKQYPRSKGQSMEPMDPSSPLFCASLLVLKSPFSRPYKDSYGLAGKGASPGPRPIQSSNHTRALFFLGMGVRCVLAYFELQHPKIKYVLVPRNRHWTDL